jgi:hypothetical protein
MRSAEATIIELETFRQRRRQEAVGSTATGVGAHAAGGAVAAPLAVYWHGPASAWSMAGWGWGNAVVWVPVWTVG